jgi:cytochrome c peroxidase
MAIPVILAATVGLGQVTFPRHSADATGPVTAVAPPGWLEPVTIAQSTLGERLFRDPRLSEGEKFSCSSCHDLEAAGADSYARRSGLDGRPLRRNSPTVFNAALNPTLGWVGGFTSLRAQAAASMTDPGVMGANWPEVLAKLSADPEYQRRFHAAYGSGPTQENVVAALAAFEQTLLTPDSRFDRYLAGDKTALSGSEVAGYELFNRIGCASCHQGRNVGGNLFQQFGLFRNPEWLARGGSDDPGRMAVTGRPSDRHVFRVPSLRNVAVTAPYFHNGGATTLPEAIGTMARSQLGRSLEPSDVELITQFLATLTGTYRGRVLSPSQPPPS